MSTAGSLGLLSNSSYFYFWADELHQKHSEVSERCHLGGRKLCPSFLLLFCSQEEQQSTNLHKLHRRRQNAIRIQPLSWKKYPTLWFVLAEFRELISHKYEMGCLKQHEDLCGKHISDIYLLMVMVYVTSITLSCVVINEFFPDAHCIVHEA